MNVMMISFELISISSSILPKSLAPVILGNTFGPASTEGSNVMLDYFMRENQKGSGNNP